MAAVLVEADLRWTMVELFKDGRPPFDLPRFPCVNERLRKAYVYGFIPPVSDGEDERTFRNCWSIPKEFARTLLMRQPETLTYGTVKRAQHQEMRFHIEVQIDSRLPRFTLEATGTPPLNERAQLVQITPKDPRFVLLTFDPWYTDHGRSLAFKYIEKFDLPNRV